MQMVFGPNTGLQPSTPYRNLRKRENLKKRRKERGGGKTPTPAIQVWTKDRIPIQRSFENNIIHSQR